MADMMKDVQGVLDTANETKAELNKVRRKSRELEDSLGDMAEASDAWNKLGQGRRARRGSRDLEVYNDAALKQAFQTIDTDKSGSIEQSGLTSAIRAMDPNASDQVIIDMIKYADADKDGKVDFEEFKRALDVLVNNAGVVAKVAADDDPRLAAWDECLQINLHAPPPATMRRRRLHRQEPYQ